MNEQMSSNISALNFARAARHLKIHAGLFHGAAGPALLFVRMYERTGDTGYLDRAEALRAAGAARRCGAAGRRPRWASASEWRVRVMRPGCA